jgi:predicted nucleic acid-binding protein
MSDNFFLDTNILIYAFSEDQAKAKRAGAILEAGGCISVQVLNEFVNVSRNKLKLDWTDIEERLGVVMDLVSDVAPLSVEMHERAVELSRDHKLSFYDALIVAAALSLRCGRLLSEDMHDGLIMKGILIENPFLRKGS